MPENNINYQDQLKGKYIINMNPPESLRELLWRIGYFRRNEPSWRELTLSFKPSTTVFSTDESIKTNTLNALDALKAFYESASTLEPKLLNNTTSNFYLRKPPIWPAKSVKQTKSQTSFPDQYAPYVYEESYQINTGLATPLESTAVSSQVTAKKVDVLRIQAANPFANIAAENISQDIENVVQTAKTILTSYGRPYTESRNEDCTKWIFNSRNTAMKAVDLIVQECPWFIQALNNFAFFNTNIIEDIIALNPGGQLYGHLESPASNSVNAGDVDSPRNLLTPLWSDEPNIQIVHEEKKLKNMLTKGTFSISYSDPNGVISSTNGTQDLLAFYCKNTYEANMFATNYAIST